MPIRFARKPQPASPSPALARLRRSAISVALASILSSPAGAATITVTVDNPVSIELACSLVDAVASINDQVVPQFSTCVQGDGVNDTIMFASNVTHITFLDPVASPTSALIIKRAMTIDARPVAGSGVPVVTLARNPSPATAFRLLEAQAPLTLRGIAVKNGIATGAGAYGGGILATDVSLFDCVVSGNVANSADGAMAFGGGIHATHANLNSSIVRDNVAEANGSNVESGAGGVYASVQISLANSTVSGNSVSNDDTAYAGAHPGGSGGGLKSANVLTLNSTISGNSVVGSAGYFYGGGGGIYANHLTMINSTVSGNTADGGGGGIATGDLSLYFSTVTANSAAHDYAGGIRLDSLIGAKGTAVASVIFGNSTTDIGGHYAVTMTGSHNLIGHHSAVTVVPNDTLSCDPRLGPLGNNGGITNTHALLAGSCAIDAGGSTSAILGQGFVSLPFDQRNYARLVGAAIDIGAFEKQGPGDPDLIFANSFER